MIIERIDEKRLLILLEKYDMTTLGISYKDISWEDTKSRIIIARLLALAKIETGFSIENSRLSIEALPQYNGCAIIFSLSPYPKNKAINSVSEPNKYSESKIMIYKFDNLDNLLNLCEKARGYSSSLQGSSIYKVKGIYYLVIYHKIDIPVHLEVLLSEYGSCLKSSSITVSHLNEQGIVIHKNNALSFIGQYMK